MCGATFSIFDFHGNGVVNGDKYAKVMREVKPYLSKISDFGLSPTMGKGVYVLYNEDKPSPFVRELTNILEPGQHLCPVCQNGHVVVIKHSTATNGTPYTTFGCSNANAGCVYFERVFGDDIPYYKQFQHENEKNHDILK